MCFELNYCTVLPPTADNSNAYYYYYVTTTVLCYKSTGLRRIYDGLHKTLVVFKGDEITVHVLCNCCPPSVADRNKFLHYSLEKHRILDIFLDLDDERPWYDSYIA